MKTFRKIVLGASIVITAIISSCNSAIARPGNGEAELSGYEYRLIDGLIAFSTAPCKAGVILVPVPAEFLLQLKAAVATAITGETLDLCWLDAGGGLVVVGPYGPALYIPLDDERLARRNKT